MIKTSLFRSCAIALALSITSAFTYAQTDGTPKPNWQNLDLTTDTTFGISTEKAYTELLKGKKAKTVVVAVIDGGVDINHEDLKGVIWTNKREKAGNKVDDDKNGYIDDIHGWNFLGSDKGSIEFENMEATRIIRKFQPKFQNITSESAVSAADLADYKQYQSAVTERNQLLAEAQDGLKSISGFKAVLDEMTKNMPKDKPALDYFQSYEPADARQGRIKNVMINVLKENPDYDKFVKDELEKGISHYTETINYHLNLDFNPRPNLVGDDQNNDNEHNYGNADVDGPDASHGSHVSGIIGAMRDNNLGIKGVANHVLIMSVRTVPNGDERDKDVANAIRYAADNGAKVINMSFGKPFSWDKKVVDDAVKYAISKDVLLIHAAGNDNKNLELESNHNYPNKTYEDKSGAATNWIEVGASGYKDDESLKASFSNYGKTRVDVFAPGVRINSTTPNSTYSVYDGTSMASPVVAGLAALIRSYYPRLTAAQVKDIILKSVVKVNHNVVIRDGQNETKVPFSDLCVTGGIVNAYNALKLAAATK
ncbi:S8 family peptidase [Mucilaginibacter paludis]|uniref:Peptidase S8 and S53 subtilisin kexin sedolisin n=1 Tax=Mucilaginibacter paludis DSM 18603 TaxID=714943 RepID=H1YH35_9SPHI|nr:S8 family peptidase [Mucilaginibacter paludis]EHQ24537.1 peptidase S8 and S53 subtilisin kexin sedolisin [Mucilaginibacter paludis DSM 18603]